MANFDIQGNGKHYFGSYTIQKNINNNTFSISINATITALSGNRIAKGSEEGIWIYGGDSDFWGKNNWEDLLLDMTLPYDITSSNSYTKSIEKTYQLKDDGTTGGTLFFSCGAGNYNLEEIKTSNGNFKKNNTWIPATTWGKISGVWKRCVLWKKINGVWKKGI